MTEKKDVHTDLRKKNCLQPLQKNALIWTVIVTGSSVTISVIITPSWLWACHGLGLRGAVFHHWEFSTDLKAYKAIGTSKDK